MKILLPAQPCPCPCPCGSCKFQSLSRENWEGPQRAGAGDQAPCFQPALLGRVDRWWRSSHHTHSQGGHCHSLVCPQPCQETRRCSSLSPSGNPPRGRQKGEPGLQHFRGAGPGTPRRVDSRCFVNTPALLPGEDASGSLPCLPRPSGHLRQGPPSCRAARAPGNHMCQELSPGCLTLAGCVLSVTLGGN